MVDYVKQDMSAIWADAGDYVAPPSSKITTGWLVEVPPRQYWNWIEHRQDLMLAYLAQKGISEWDAATQYHTNKSYVQYNGVVYKAKTINTNVIPSSSTLDWEVAFVAPTAASEAIKSVTPSADTLAYFTGATTASTAPLTAFARTILDDADASAVRTTISAQALNSNLTAISGLTSAANKLPYFTGSGTAALTDITTFARSLLDDVDAAAARTTLGVSDASTLTSGILPDARLSGTYTGASIGGNAATATKLATARTINGVNFDGTANITIVDATKQPLNNTLSSLASLVAGADNLPYFTGAGTLGLATITAVARNLLAATTQAAQRSALGLGTAATSNVTTDRTSFAVGNTMRVGDFGLGDVAVTINDPDVIYRPMGFYEVADTTSWASRPATGWTRIIHLPHSNQAGYASQIAFGNFEAQGTNRMFIRTAANGVWTAWMECWHTGNFDPNSKVSVDWIKAAGLDANNPASPYMRKADDNSIVYLQPRLGFTPVQQGGGANQGTSKIYIGWDGTGVRVQVDNTDIGQFWTESNAFSKIANGQAGDIGTYGFFTIGGGGGVTPGTLVAGSNLKWAGAGYTSASAPAGTWRIMGQVLNADGSSSDSTTLCLRVS